MDNDVLVSPAQAARLMALCAMVRNGDLSFRGDDDADEQSAKDVLKDIGEEIALQVAGYA